MEKEKLKEPYLDAKIEIAQISLRDLIATSDQTSNEGWNNSTSNGWT